MNKLQSYFIASVLYVMTPHAFAQGTVTIYLPSEQQTLSVGPVENVVQLVTQPQLRDRLWWPGALLTDSAAKAKALKDYQHVMAQLASWEAATTIVAVRSLSRYPALVRLASAVKLSSRFPAHRFAAPVAISFARLLLHR